MLSKLSFKTSRPGQKNLETGFLATGLKSQLQLRNIDFVGNDRNKYRRNWRRHIMPLEVRREIRISRDFPRR